MIPKNSVKVPSQQELREIAMLALVDVSKNAKATPAARAAAARTILESLGDIGRLQEVASRAAKPLTELTKNEVDAEIERLGEQTRDRRLGPDLLTIEHRDIKV